MLLMIDNYDSFTYNIVQYFGELGEEVRTVRNDEVTIDEIAAMQPDRICISPGPKAPVDAGVSVDVIKQFQGKLPILGVCLGHQAIGAAFGGRVERAARPLHGQATPIHHEGRGLFANLPDPMMVGRYHSLIVTPDAGMADRLAIDAVSAEGEVMALSHRSHPTWGIQFHPESVLTQGGHALFANFLGLADAWRGQSRAEPDTDAVD